MNGFKYFQILCQIFSRPHKQSHLDCQTATFKNECKKILNVELNLILIRQIKFKKPKINAIISALLSVRFVHKVKFDHTGLKIETNSLNYKENSNFSEF